VGQRSLNVIEISAIRKMGAVSYSPFIVTMAVSVAVCDIFSVKEWRDLETRLGIVQGHCKLRRSTDYMRSSIGRLLQI